MASKTIDLHFLKVKSTSLASGSAETTPPPALAYATSLLRGVPGVESLHLGRQLEDDGLTSWAMVATWESEAAAAAFDASESLMPFRAALRVAVDNSGDGSGWNTRRIAVKGKSADAGRPGEAVARALGAPTTEIFTALGVDDAYYGRAAAFTDGINAEEGAVPGYHGGGYGRVHGRVTGVADGKEVEGDTVVLFLGWDSMQAHFDAKAEEDKVLATEIGKHLYGWKSCEMAHVNFRKI